MSDPCRIPEKQRSLPLDWRISIIPGVRPDEEEDDCVEEERVEGAPERVGHGLDDDPPDDHVVGVEDGAVRHDKAREAARVAAKDHDG